jgi:hypothetical protein
MAIRHESEQHFELIIWIIFGMRVFDLYLKHIIVGEIGSFSLNITGHFIYLRGHFQSQFAMIELHQWFVY